MPKSLWNGPAALALTYIACGLFIAFISFTLAYSKGYKSADHEHETNNAQRDTSDVIYGECLRAAADLDGALECVNNTNATSRDAERSEQDLNAQREMAQWAEGMLWATIFIGSASLGATVFGVRDGRTTTLRSIEEIPQAMTRFPINLDLYKAEKQSK